MLFRSESLFRQCHYLRQNFILQNDLHNIEFQPLLRDSFEYLKGISIVIFFCSFCLARSNFFCCKKNLHLYQQYFCNLLIMFGNNIFCSVSPV